MMHDDNTDGDITELPTEILGAIEAVLYGYEAEEARQGLATIRNADLTASQKTTVANALKEMLEEEFGDAAEDYDEILPMLGDFSDLSVTELADKFLAVASAMDGVPVTQSDLNEMLTELQTLMETLHYVSDNTSELSGVLNSVASAVSELSSEEYNDPKTLFGTVSKALIETREAPTPPSPAENPFRHNDNDDGPSLNI